MWIVILGEDFERLINKFCCRLVWDLLESLWAARSSHNRNTGGTHFVRCFWCPHVLTLKWFVWKHRGRALTGVALLVGRWPTKQNVSCSIPGQGITCLGCRFWSWLGCVWEATDWCFSLTSMFLSLSTSFPLSRKIKKKNFFLKYCYLKTPHRLSQLFAGTSWNNLKLQHRPDHQECSPEWGNWSTPLYGALKVQAKQEVIFIRLD